MAYDIDCPRCGRAMEYAYTDRRGDVYRCPRDHEEFINGRSDLERIRAEAAAGGD